MKKSIILFLFCVSFSYAEEVTLKTPSGVLHGTLQTPEIADASMTVVLIVPGSGPTDRDGNNSGIPGKNNSLRYLSEALAKNGIASLRIDKRGVAASKAAASAEKEMKVETYVNDVTAWIRYLQDERKLINIVLLGHSEGSLICMLAAEVEKVAAFISVAGAGRPVPDIILDQVRPQFSQKLFKETENILIQLQSGKEVKDVSPILNSLFRPSVQPYLISLFKHDPAKEFAKLSIRTLIAQGSTDVQVSPGDAELLHKAKPDSQIILIKEMNHVLKHAAGVAGPIQLAAYTDPNLPVHEGLVESIANFIKELHPTK